MKKKTKILIGCGIAAVVVAAYLIYSLIFLYRFPGVDEHKIILEYQYINMGCVPRGEIHDYTIRVFSDGNYEISLDEEDIITALENPVGEFMMSENDVEQIKTSIQQNYFFWIPKDISRDGSDGYESYITVYTTSRKRTCGGYLAENSRYDNLENVIWDLTNETRNEFFEEKQKLVDAYYEKNEK